MSKNKVVSELLLLSTYYKAIMSERQHYQIFGSKIFVQELCVKEFLFIKILYLTTEN